MADDAPAPPLEARGHAPYARASSAAPRPAPISTPRWFDPTACVVPAVAVGGAGGEGRTPPAGDGASLASARTTALTTAGATVDHILKLESSRRGSYDARRIDADAEVRALQRELAGLRVASASPAPPASALQESIMREAVAALCCEAALDVIAVAKRKVTPTDEVLATVNDLFDRRRRAGEKLYVRFNADIYRKDYQCMAPLVNVNDEVINCWFNLIRERSVRRQAEHDAVVARLARATLAPAAAEGGPGAPSLDGAIQEFNSLADPPMSVYLHPTYFWAKLTENGYTYANVRRWTKRKKVDVFALSRLIFGININGTHWTMGIAKIPEREVQYWDPMGATRTDITDRILRYLADEHQDKKGAPLDVSQWRATPAPPDLPVQTNGVDCGAFLCANADYASENRPFDYTQEDMPAIRRRVALAIHSGWLL